MTSTKTLVRVAGLLYLIVGIFGGFAEGFVQPKMYVAGDAAATTNQVVQNADLVRWGVAADLTQATVFLFLGLILARLFRPLAEEMTRTMLLLVSIATAIMCLNNVFEFGGLRVATDGQFATALGIAGQQTIVYLLLDLQHYGLLIAQIFFGLWLIPLGLLVRKSGLFPQWLGVLLVIGGVCYLLNLLTLFLVPAFGELIKAFIVIPCAVAEIAMVVSLLIGVKAPKSA